MTIGHKTMTGAMLVIAASLRDHAPTASANPSPTIAPMPSRLLASIVMNLPDHAVVNVKDMP